VTRSSTRTVVTAAAVVEGAHIVWLRAGDLRTHDHPALTAAAAMADRKVLPVFVFDPEECELCTPATVGVIHEAVVELRGTLRDMGSDLAVLIGDPVVELPKLANAVGATTVTAQVRQL
jgi:deoxyribodipyrimidine photo-lyase